MAKFAEAEHKQGIDLAAGFLAIALALAVFTSIPSPILKALLPFSTPSCFCWQLKLQGAQVLF